MVHVYLETIEGVNNVHLNVDDSLSTRVLVELLREHLPDKVADRSIIALVGGIPVTHYQTLRELLDSGGNSGSPFVALQLRIPICKGEGKLQGRADEFIALIRRIGQRIVKAQPREFTAGNILRRVLAIVREEISDSTASASANSAPVNTAMFRLLVAPLDKEEEEQRKKERSAIDAENDGNSHKDVLRSVVIQGIRELIDEIDSVHENIAQMTVDLIHDNEVLLTPTPGSETVLNFLLKASLKRKFTVLITENYPNDIELCHRFAKKLAEAEIETVIIPDSTVFAVMSRVGKVLIGARAVFANGGCVTAAGVATACECAKEHRTPVFTVAGLYKFSPSYPFDRNSLIEVGNSGKVLPYADSDLVGKCEVTTPIFDYVPPEYIDIYITNIGGFSPNFVYRIVLDNYRTEDVEFS
ncbi:hypothetical protein FOA43_002290 [Brettanomyces nanus]|uniref:Translation initiation factor eIF2B subunit beta n=1 Tax=Eeniella nana TaxID=13502 RepID=A0A875RZI9_EENNA|nr:uncharacterized protein FOA43_002290 [Brettanomyces nanus]QPG74951.1 hypothetical protein FOA43_002290 [Brettanomyces nanus]